MPPLGRGEDDGGPGVCGRGRDGEVLRRGGRPRRRHVEVYDERLEAERGKDGSAVRKGELKAEVMDRRLRTWARPATLRHLAEDLNRTRPVACATVTAAADVEAARGTLSAV